MNEWTELNDSVLFYHLGRLAYSIHKFHEDNAAGLLDPDKAKEDVEYYNSICRDHADIEYELEERGFYQDVDTGEWIKAED